MKKRFIPILYFIVLMGCGPAQIDMGKDDDFLKEELKEILNLIPEHKKGNEEVSKVSVGWHLYHTLLTMNEIYDVMKSSRAETYVQRFNLTRTLMFSSNQIPRGKAKSPQRVTPPAVFSSEDIKLQFYRARTNMSFVDAMHEKAHFTHPSAGTLNREDSKRFLKIHTEHHLKIIRDILRQKNK